MRSADLVAALRHAVQLLRAHPAHWLALALLFMLGVESLMLLPYIGFLAKVAVAGLLSAQSLRLFNQADAGKVPHLPTMMAAWSLPLGAQAALVGAALLPFGLGIALLLSQGPEAHAGFFFGHLGAADAQPPPSPGLLLAFKLVMHCTGVWLSFVAAAVIMLGRRGWTAIVHGLWLAARNPLALALLLAFALGYEALATLLPQVLSPGLALLAGLLLLVITIAWSLALQYTLSLRAILREHTMAGVLGSADGGPEATTQRSEPADPGDPEDPDRPDGPRRPEDR